MPLSNKGCDWVAVCKRTGFVLSWGRVPGRGSTFTVLNELNSAAAAGSFIWQSPMERVNAQIPLTRSVFASTAGFPP